MTKQTPAVESTEAQTTDLNALAGMNVVLRSKKAGREESVSITDLPESSIRAILRYGAMRFINDKLGGLEDTEAATKFDEILAVLKNGWEDQRQGSGGGAKSIDPVVREMESLAWNRIKAALKNKGIPLKAIEAGKKAELIAGLIEKHEGELRPQAEAIVAAKGKTLDLGDLDLGDLNT